MGAGSGDSDGSGFARAQRTAPDTQWKMWVTGCTAAHFMAKGKRENCLAKCALAARHSGNACEASNYVLTLSDSNWKNAKVKATIAAAATGLCLGCGRTGARREAREAACKYLAHVHRASSAARAHPARTWTMTASLSQQPAVPGRAACPRGHRYNRAVRQVREHDVRSANGDPSATLVEARGPSSPTALATPVEARCARVRRGIAKTDARGSTAPSSTARTRTTTLFWGMYSEARPTSTAPASQWSAGSLRSSVGFVTPSSVELDHASVAPSPCFALTADVPGSLRRYYSTARGTA